MGNIVTKYKHRGTIIKFPRSSALVRDYATA